MLRGGKGFNDFKFGTFIGRFSSDGAANMAVKGLIYIYIYINKQDEKATENCSVCVRV